MALKTIVFEDKKFDISYEILNQKEIKVLVFLHGWGSNKEIMKQAFSSYLKDFKHIYIDMPGFGKSPNSYVLTTFDYANIVKEFLKELNCEVLAVFGHSFGGKVATLLNPKNLILLSSAGILEKKSLKVKLKILSAKFLNSIGLKNFTKIFRSKDVNLMSENMYKTFKNVVDEDFSKYFETFSNNALIFWGESDSATALSSGKKIAQLIKNSKFISYPQDHYFFLKNASDISKRVENGIS